MSRYLYDITNPNVAYNWLYEALKMKQGDLIDAYCLECHKDVNAFYEKYRIVMDSIDIEKLEIAAFHVTTCVDDCNEIKLYGLHNLQWVLENDTQLRRFLKQNYISLSLIHI